MRERAMVLVVIALLPFGLLIYRNAADQRQWHRDKLAEQAGQLARLVTAKHAETLAYANESLALAALELREPAVVRDCGAWLRHLAAAAPVHSISLADPSGRIHCSSAAGAAGADVGGEDYFLRAISSRGLSTSGLVLGRFDDGYVVQAAHPVEGNGRIESVLIAEIGLGWIPRALAEYGAPPGFSVAVLSSSGEALYRFPDRVDTAVASGSMPLPGPALQPAVVRVDLPVALADQPAGDALRRGLWLLGACFALALVLALLGSTLFVVRPLRRLTEAAANLDAGDLSARTGVPHDDHEIGRLARQLDTLAAHREKVTRALRALSAGNRALLREQDEAELLQAMCRVAATRGGYPLAVVYYAADDEEKSVVPAAHSGDDRGALDALHLTWADNERGQGTVARAIRSGRTTVFQSIAQEPGSLPWRQALLGRGFGAVASMPLSVEGRVIGTFTLFADETDAFDREELELVQEMADDLAFGIGVCRDRVRQRDAEREARRIATRDSLTELYNRSYFLNALGEAAAAAAGRHGALAVLSVHIRDMPALLDSLGYGPGTEVVREIGERLRRVVSEEDVLARVLPDEFALFRADTDAEAARALAAELHSVFATPLALGEAQIDVQGHVGASFFPGHGDEPDLLLRRAAIAARGGAKRDQAYTIYAGATEREDPGRLQLVAHLRAAIDARELQLHFQPKVDLAQGRVVGSEALARWQHAERGSVPPSQFVPLAEQTGLIRDMTYLVLETAIRQQRAWLDAGLRLPVAVNLSVRNLYDPRLVERIEGLLATWGVPADLLELEITEGALVEEPRVARAVLERLRGAGSRVFIDDFGTGYSSLSYLVSLPVHALKIDRSFIVQMSASEQAHAVVSSIISLGQQLGLRVIAEGVERAQERDTLVAMGCDEAQGYLFGRPMAPEAFRAALPP